MRPCVKFSGVRACAAALLGCLTVLAAVAQTPAHTSTPSASVRSDASMLGWMQRAHRPASAASAEAPTRVLSASAPVPGVQAVTPPAISAQQAAALYQQHCASCHGAQRLGAMAPALLPESLERIRAADMVKTIREGRPATQMNGFAHLLSAAEI